MKVKKLLKGIGKVDKSLNKRVGNKQILKNQQLGITKKALEERNVPYEPMFFKNTFEQEKRNFL